MAKINAWDKKEKTMRNKLERKLKYCPHGKSYENLAGKTRYYCDLVPNKDEGRYIAIGVSSHNNCKYEDIITCPLLGNAKITSPELEEVDEKRSQDGSDAPHGTA